MVIKNGKSARKRQPKPAQSSAKPNRSPVVPQDNLDNSDQPAAAELDGVVDDAKATALESEKGDPVLETPGADNRASRDAVSAESTELTAITVHQPWASLIAAGKKHYETRSWPTNHRGLIAIHAGKKFEKDESLTSLLEIEMNLFESNIPLGAVVAIAQLTDCTLMTQEFINEQSSFEQYLGLWEIGRYAWKLENVRAIAPIPATGKQGLWKWNPDSWNPADFGELHHVAEANGQLNLLDWTDKEPPEPDDYESIELFDQAYKQWANAQTDEAEEELASFGVDELRDQLISKLSAGNNEPPEPDDYESIKLFDAAYKQWCDAQTETAKLEYFCPECKTWMPRSQIKEEFFGDYQTQVCKCCLTEVYHEFDNRSPQLEIKGQELCNQLINGSICAVESVPVSLTQGLNCGDDRPITSANGIPTAIQSSNIDTQVSTELVISENAISSLAVPYSSSLLARLANHSQLMESNSEQAMSETVFPTCSEQSENCSPNSQSSKMSADFSIAPIPQATKPGLISGLSSTAYTRSGSMLNGKLSAAPTLPAPGVEKESLLLRSPGALSSSGKASPPGKTRLETQLQQLGLISAEEVAAPEFLENGYQLPIGFSNPAENRTALELAQIQAQQLPIAPKSELPVEIQTTAIVEAPSETLSIGELPPSDSDELNISVILPPNIGALTKTELISAATEQHQLICTIERKEFELAIEKLHRVRLTGVYLQEFKKKCQYGEFENQLEQAGIGVRSAQQYMVISKNWEIVEAKAKLVSLLSEETPAIGLKWALEAVRDEKKSLKSAAAPFDPDCWQTPNTKDQPIVDLIKKALGGSIWLDPCSHSSGKIPAAVRYYKDGFDGDGLAENQIWNKTVFINPPFSNPLPWVEKCCFSIALGTCSAAIMLLKSGTLSNVGTGELINKYASAVCHWRGRIAFLNDEGNAVKGSDFDCIFVYFGDRLDLFRQAFSGRGTISTIENHFSSVNKKFLENNGNGNGNGNDNGNGNGKNFTNVVEEEKELAAAVGLSNGQSVLPDTRDNDRERLERYDPHTVPDSMMYTTTVIPKQTDLFDQAKRNCLADYVSKVEENLIEFSDEQISYLLEILEEEKADRKANRLKADIDF